MFSKLFLPYDIYERHKKVAEEIEDGQTIIDVGGQLNLLSKFTKPAKIIVANLAGSEEKSDVELNRGKLPFAANSFDVVTAIDVLEHISSKDRKNFIKDSTRIAKDKVVLSFPIGTLEHIKYEKEIQTWLARKGHEVGYLKEHLKYGLPTTDDIKNLTYNLKEKLTFSGDLKINKFLFKMFIFDPKIFLIRRIVFVAKNIFYLLANPFLYTLLSNKKFSNKVVRAYLVIYKQSFSMNK